MSNKNTSILVVAKDLSTRERLSSFLGSGYSCATSATAEQAIALLTHRSFDLVITDRELPGVSGLALCQFIQKTRPGTAVILMSGRISQWHRTVAEWLGVFDCITMPCNLLALLELIERSLLSRMHENVLDISESVEAVHQTA